MKHPKQLLGYLKQIHAEPPLKDAGICLNVNELIYGEKQQLRPTKKFSQEIQRELNIVMCQWPKYSQWYSYPIPPADKHQDPSDAFWVNLDKAWDRRNPYCALRWELLEFCIEYLEKEVSK